MCDKLERVKFMSVLCEAQFLVRRLGGGNDVRPQLGIRTAFRCINCWCGTNRRKALSHNRVRDCWYGRQSISVSADELEILRAAARSKHDEVDPRDKEISELRGRLAALEERLSVGDVEFHVPTLDALRTIPRGYGRTTGDEG